MKKLTENEVQKLFDFSRKHYVEYYDLQIEIVDHLACGIEEQWKEDEYVFFDDALEKEFKKFGIFGFSDIVDNRKIELQKKYKKVINRAILDHLKRKEYVGLMMLFALIYFLISLIDAKITFLTAIILFYGLAFYQIIRLNKIYKLKIKELGYKLVLVESIYKNFISISAISAFSNLGIQSLIYYDFNITYLNIVISVILPICILILYVSCYYLPKHSDQIIKELSLEFQLIIK